MLFLGESCVKCVKQFIIRCHRSFFAALYLHELLKKLAFFPTLSKYTIFFSAYKQYNLQMSYITPKLDSVLALNLLSLRALAKKACWHSRMNYPGLPYNLFFFFVFASVPSTCRQQYNLKMKTSHGPQITRKTEKKYIFINILYKKIHEAEKTVYRQNKNGYRSSF